MLKFTIPCNFSGQKSEVDFFMGSPHPLYDPIEFQRLWLARERDGSIEFGITENFVKMHKIALKNNVDLEELYLYASDYNKGITPTQKKIPEKKLIEDSMLSVEGNILKVDFKKFSETNREQKFVLVKWLEKEREIAENYVEDIATSIISPIDDYSSEARNMLAGLTWWMALVINSGDNLYERILDTLSNLDPYYNLAVGLDCIGKQLPDTAFKYLASSFMLNNSVRYSHICGFIIKALENIADIDENPFDKNIIKTIAKL